MMKRIFLAIALLFAAAPALAAEHAGSGSTPTLEAGWTGSNFAALSVSNAWNKRAYKSDPTVIKDHTYLYDLVGSSTSGTGAVQVYVTGTHDAAPAGAWVPADIEGVGATPIADNFDYASGLTSVAQEPREADPNGSLRFNCGVFYSNDDPIVYPSKPGKSHTHMVLGNTGFNANSTYKSLRTTGGTTCGRSSTPINRAVYWAPAMIGGSGEIRNPYNDLLYYKEIGNLFAECATPGMTAAQATDATHVGYCSSPFHGLRWVWGCKMSDMSSCPSAAINYQCMTAADDRIPEPGTDVPGHPTGVYNNIDDLIDTGACQPGDVLKYDISSPACWNGHNLDSPDHMSHVAGSNRGAVPLNGPGDDALFTSWGTPAEVDPVNRSWGGCPATHPYLLPSISIQFWYKTDAAFFAHKWHLSCDEQMTMAMKAGSCGHFDYWEAWSPTAIATAIHNCFDLKNSSNFMELCDGTAVIGVVGPTTANAPPALTRSRLGWSRLYSGNGHWTGELKAMTSGELGINAVGGATGNYSLSITDVTPVGKHNQVSVSH